VTDVVQFVDVARDYGATPAVRGVSLSIAAGEWVALVGRSGSGKSTLLSILGGLDRGYRGRAVVAGRDLAALSERELARLRHDEIGFVFQSFQLLGHLTARDNVALPAWFGPSPPTGGAARRAVRARAEALLGRVGMGALADRRPDELSGGQRQRVAIARALFTSSENERPKSLLLADEPTGSLDVETGDQILALLEELHQEGLAICVVTHEERVSRAARRVLRMEDGRLT